MCGYRNDRVAAAGVCAVLALVMSAAPAPAVASAAPATTRSAIDVAVDPRVELFSLLFKLAGNPEYAQPRVDRYDEDVEDRFGSQRRHPAVRLARRLRNENSVSYDAPMSLAMHVSPPPELKLLVKLDPWPEDIDARWTAQSVEQFLAEARKFVDDQQFMKFFAEHRPLYEQTCARMRQTLARQGVVPWFDRFFGARSGTRFHVYLGMMNGGSCYGSKLVDAQGGGEDDYCILGVWKTDDQGVPTFPPDEVLPTVVHEFAHSYMNPLVDKHEKELAAAGRALFPTVEQQMRRQAYGQWQTMLRESMVRVTVVRYRTATEGPLAGIKEIGEQVARGFTWIPQLSGCVAEYEAHRDKYATFDAFMPRVVEFFNDYAKRSATTSPSPQS
jgi:hypothetical protein